MANLNLGQDVANKKCPNFIPLYQAINLRRFVSLINMNPSELKYIHSGTMKKDAHLRRLLKLKDPEDWWKKTSQVHLIRSVTHQALSLNLERLCSLDGRTQHLLSLIKLLKLWLGGQAGQLLVCNTYILIYLSLLGNKSYRIFYFSQWSSEQMRALLLMLPNFFSFFNSFIQIQIRLDWRKGLYWLNCINHTLLL